MKQAMIFAAGLGTRLKPLTDRIPKALVRVGNKTLLERVIDILKDADTDEIVINVHHFAEQIRVNPETYLIQSLTLQPLVENAIKHGLRPKEKGGTIILSADEKPDWIELAVQDDGAGFSLTEKNPLAVPCEGHIGLRNVHERLCSQYGKSCGLAIESCPGAGTTVTIRIPKRIFMDGEKHVENFTCG